MRHRARGLPAPDVIMLTSLLTKLRVEFQYGRRLLFQTRSRYISAINLYILTIGVDEIWFVDKF